MISFENDYVNGAHPKVLEHLIETNGEVLSGYGTDACSRRAEEKILAACRCPEGAVFFVSGGTQTNQLVIDTMLAPYEGVIAAESGHVAMHEAGAVEYTGHKVLPLPETEGRLSAADVETLCAQYHQADNQEQLVRPGMVYISYPTEYGTLYSRRELEELAAVCRRYKIPLFLDGARLAYGLASPCADVTLADIAALCDVFYIGGTKAGTLCGEAVVFTGKNTPRCFRAQIKRHGAMLAKGRLMGAQFEALFTDDLYGEIGRHGIAMAEKLKEILRAKGCSFYLDSPTNQQFVILENARIEEINRTVRCCYWEPCDEGRSVVRFATSWSTTEDDLRALERCL